MNTQAMKFETKEQATEYAAANNLDSWGAFYESGHYQAVTGFAEGWYLMCGHRADQIWQEAA